jgi:hypothetical protein
MWKTELARLSAEDAITTYIYLKELSEKEPDISVGVQSLFGRCCLSTLPGVSINLNDLASEAARLGRRIVDHPDAQQLQLDPLLLIEIHRILAGAGKTVPVLDDLHRRMAMELYQQPAETKRVGRVRVIASRLEGLGYPAEPARPDKATAARLRDPGPWFGASVAQLADVADHLAADGLPLDHVATRVLSLIALAELRNYRVDLGCTLLRTVFELGEPCHEAADALLFIALQRRRDGRYGFANHAGGSVDQSQDPQLSMFLPLTVNAVWLFRTEAERSTQLQAAASA